MNTLTLCAPAKINLFLAVSKRRPDGYHELDSVMQAVSLYDRLTIEKSDAADIHLICTDPSLPCDGRNLAYRAAQAFFKEFGLSFGVRITLEKQIPMQAGLGGGSADAAAVLHGLNALCDYPFSKNKLAVIGASLGADVPFCVKGGSCHACGIGERLVPISTSCNYFLAIGMGDVGVSTKEAYAALDATPIPQEPSSHQMRQALAQNDYTLLCKQLYNSFERVIPVVSPLKQAIADTGADGVLMSGSGAAVFGLFSDAGRARYCVDQLHQKGYRGYLCSPLTEAEVFPCS